MQINKDEYSSDESKSEFKQYGRIFKKLIRLILYISNLKGENHLKMDWDERGLFALNLDYLWRWILFTQDKVCSHNDKTLNEKIRYYEKCYYEKNEVLVKELDERDKQIKKLLTENK